MASKRNAARATAEATANASGEPLLTEPMSAEAGGAMPDWLHRAVEQGIQPEQALAVIGLGLMRRMAGGGDSQPWDWSLEEEESGRADLTALRQRLDLIQLALETGAPLSTAEVSELLGARPEGPRLERGGVIARRRSRNVWTLGRAETESSRSGSSFSDSFRRRL
jgi:hypothetical protein